MKFLLSVFMLVSLNAFASDSVIEPSVSTCDKETLAAYVKMGKTTVIPTNIRIEARETFEGDPAVWSTLHKIKVEFPIGKTGKKACLLIDNAMLNQLTKVRSIGYDSKKGRLIKMKVAVAVGNAEGEISAKDIDLKVRVNQATGSLELE